MPRSSVSNNQINKKETGQKKPIRPSLYPMHFEIPSLIRQGARTYHELLIMINLSNLAVPN